MSKTNRKNNLGKIKSRKIKAKIQLKNKKKMIKSAIWSKYRMILSWETKTEMNKKISIKRNIKKLYKDWVKEIYVI